GLPTADIDVSPLAARLGLRRAPRVLLAPGRVPPFLSAAWGTPVVVVPADLWARLPDDQREALLLHELAHLARGDHWVRRLELLVLALYWWCPVAWIACRALRQAEEECCDAWVLWASPEAGSAYAGALVETLAFLSERPAGLPIAACGAGPVFALNRRLSMILQGTTPRRLSRAGLLLVALAGLLLPLAPTVADAPAFAPADEAGVASRLIASSPACRACHEPAKPVPSKSSDAGVLAEKLDKEYRVVRVRAADMIGYRALGEKLAGSADKADSDKLHDLIVKLMREMEAQKEQMKAREAQLKAVLAQYEKMMADKAREKAKSRPVPTAEKRIEELEEQLKKVADELRKLREEAKPKSGTHAPKSPSYRHLPTMADRERATKVFTRTLSIPLRTDGTAKAVELWVTTDGGKAWKLAVVSKAGAGALKFHAPADGRYGFKLVVDGGAKPAAGAKPDLEVEVEAAARP
ncbi:MAG: hypothetical protein K2W96_03345, partial [Gemmataceae bacterium]|nr:hypothetical protein [Gemmataceae bacterium]